MSRQLKPCGTRAAYYRHLLHGETPCLPCTDANAAYVRALYDRKARPPLQPCGTPAAYNRHKGAGEEACEACRDAWAAYMAAWRAACREAS